MDFSMVALKLDIVLFLNIFYVSDCTRRIKDGQPVTTGKRYVVYLIKAPLSDKIYDAWVCGGALVTTLFIITSAACVDDVEYMYAIAGYDKYIRDEDIEKNACTKAKKKKIVYTCIPLKYELEYDKLEKWSLIDIALVKVESPYDFEDQSYNTLCSYIPATIPINFEQRYQEPGTDGFVLGWGHTEVWRQPSDENNYNQEILRYAPIRIMDKEACKLHYEMFPNMGTVIDKYMICTLEKGDLDDSGQMTLVDQKSPKLDGCERGFRLRNNKYEPCNNDDDDPTRRGILRSNQVSNDSTFYIKNGTVFNQTTISRKSGICQNDHGGPLVTWVGAMEVLIGVASVFKVSSDSKCMGPYLYTSTQCNGAFIDCILSHSYLPDYEKRRAICDIPPIQRGYDTVERYISWKNHPAGAADNEALPIKKYVVDRVKVLEEFEQLGNIPESETIAIRPQVPLE